MGYRLLGTNMKIHIIHDSRRQERYEPLIETLRLNDVKDYEIFPCIIKDPVVSAINASHKMIVSMAKEQGLKEVCIAEDDLMFPCNGAWEYFLKYKPTAFHIYAACNYLNTPLTPYSTNHVKEIFGFHLYIVHYSYYDIFLATRDESHIDMAQKGDKYQLCVCYPYAALQRPGFSWNNMKYADYNTRFKPEDVYQCNPL